MTLKDMFWLVWTEVNIYEGTYLINITGQTQQHRKQPFVQLVHWRHTILSLHHLSTLPNHVDHQAVEQLTGRYLHQRPDRLDYSLASIAWRVSLYQMFASNIFCERPDCGNCLIWDDILWFVCHSWTEPVHWCEAEMGRGRWAASYRWMAQQNSAFSQCPRPQISSSFPLMRPLKTKAETSGQQKQPAFQSVVGTSRTKHTKRHCTKQWGGRLC